MTEWESIKDIRLKIDDPQGFINLETVSTPSLLPANPIGQTAYRVESTGGYYETSKKSGAISSDYTYIDIQISDAQLLAIISDLGQNKAVCRAINRIAAKLGSQLGIVRTQDGAESTQYLALLDAYKYYKALAADCAEAINSDAGNNSGRAGLSSQPEIGGGNL